MCMYVLNESFLVNGTLAVFIIVAITEKNYPERVAQQLLKEMSDKFVAKVRFHFIASRST